ncbi:hypothetical protein [Cohnella silvisoli]|uniref:Uncharacterized protein n=1 Tax=Cohnella silvisoli TaxID=2873699 RepID=A0ABV1KU84_9BACL|nr:hypothetical protein [Cohnella silvisoli]MCD9021269.1 hypothetical protein [Cohnella silvisoli]
MSEERLSRLEDMMGQLIGMVGKVLGEQQDMKQDMNAMKQDMSTMNERLERIETEQIKYHESHSYVLDKIAQHDHDIHVLKTRVLKI